MPDVFGKGRFQGENCTFKKRYREKSRIFDCAISICIGPTRNHQQYNHAFLPLPPCDENIRLEQEESVDIFRSLTFAYIHNHQHLSL